MDKKRKLKIITILIIVIHIFYLIQFSGYLIRQTWLVREGGEIYYLSQSLHNYKLSKVSNVLFPKESSSKIISSVDYSNSLLSKATNITLIYRIIQFIQIAIIVILIVRLKNCKEKN